MKMKATRAIDVLSAASLADVKTAFFVHIM